MTNTPQNELLHTIRGGETLQSIATRYYGTADRWRSLVDTNQLRPPYISDDPLAQCGQRLQRYALVRKVSPGTMRLTIGGAGNPEVLRPGARIVLERPTGIGPIVRDMLEVKSYASSAINLTASLTNAYNANTYVDVFAPAVELPGRVLRSGDLLRVPGIVPLEAPPEIDQHNLYGRDIATDASGQLMLDDSGDLALTSGTDNLIQQLRRRVHTVQGTLLRHPTYGCRAEQFIGQASLPDTLRLIEAWTGLALVDDPRVEAVTFVSATVLADAIIVTARVKIHDEAVEFSLAFR